MALEYPDVTEYGRFEQNDDLNFRPGYQVQDWIRNMMMQRGRPEPMGADIPHMPLMDELDLNRAGPRTPSVRPEDMDRAPRTEFDDEEVDPRQAYIGRQLAGDIVRMPTETMRDSVWRQLSTDPMRTMAGQHSIGTLGGRESPYLDLLNVLSFPGGGSMAPPIRRR